MVKEEHPEAVDNYLVPMLPSWMGCFKEVLEKSDFSSGDLAIPNELLKVICGFFTMKGLLTTNWCNTN